MRAPRREAAPSLVVVPSLPPTRVRGGASRRSDAGSMNASSEPHVEPASWKTSPRLSTAAAVDAMATTSSAASHHRKSAVSGRSGKASVCSDVRSPCDIVGNVQIIVATKAACSATTDASGSGCSFPGTKLSRMFGCALSPNAAYPPQAVAVYSAAAMPIAQRVPAPNLAALLGQRESRSVELRRRISAKNVGTFWWHRYENATIGTACSHSRTPPRNQRAAGSSPPPMLPMSPPPSPPSPPRGVSASCMTVMAPAAQTIATKT